MKAFLTLWDENIELRRTKLVECSKLIVSDGAEIDIEGDKCQLFNVVSQDGIIPHVAVIEIL